MVCIKIGVLILFVLIAFTAFSSTNLEPFAPMGIAGIGAAASSIFFSFIGLDAVSTAGEEVKNPQRTLPLAIILALCIVTGLYVLVALAAVASQPWTTFEGQEAGLAAILRNITGAAWPSLLLSAGAVISIFSVTLVVIYGQTRIFFVMARDGLLPEKLAEVHPKWKTPYIVTAITGVVVAVAAAFLPVGALADIANAGTLYAFFMVAIAVMLLRKKEPNRKRPFTVPGLIIVGLAPGFHGANATGRPFTGDHAGLLLYRTLHRFGFASRPESKSRDDGLELLGCRISNSVKCVPPENKPTPAEIRTCNRYLTAELSRVSPRTVLLALGSIARVASHDHAARRGELEALVAPRRQTSANRVDQIRPIGRAHERAEHAVSGRSPRSAERGGVTVEQESLEP